jgi:uncharacterized metal-binding protein
MSAQRVNALSVAYACSGCSSAGEIADHVARRLDQAGLAEMGSIAGIGGEEPQQLCKAKSRFPVIAIDGCVNACARRCLERHGIAPARHYVLSRLGVAKRSRTAGFDAAAAERILQTISAELS